MNRTRRIAVCKAGFPLGEFFQANKEKNNLIAGDKHWRHHHAPNHIRFLLVRAKKSPSGKRP